MECRWWLIWKKEEESEVMMCIWRDLASVKREEVSVWNVKEEYEVNNVLITSSVDEGVMNMKDE